MWAPPAGLSNTSSSSNLVFPRGLPSRYWPAQPYLASVGNRSWAAGWYGCGFTSLQSQYTFTQLFSKVFLNKYNKTFSCDLTLNIMTKYIMKKNWTCSPVTLELTLDSCFNSCFIMLHKTIYEINSTLLLRTPFKPPLSVCNNFLLRSHVEFGHLLLLKYAIYSLLYRCTDVHIHLKKIIPFCGYIFFLCVFESFTYRQQYGSAKMTKMLYYACQASRWQCKH